MDTMDAAQKLVNEFGVSWEDARRAIDWESADIRTEAKPRRISYSDSIDSAYEQIASWITTANEYMVALDWKDIASFQSSHRPACVWAVLVGKSRG